MTLHISKEGNIVMIALPLPEHGGSPGPDFIPSNRQNGLVLSGVNFSTKRHRRDTGIVSSASRRCGFVDPIEARDAIAAVLDAIEAQNPMPESP